MVRYALRNVYLKLFCIRGFTFAWLNAIYVIRLAWHGATRRLTKGKYTMAKKAQATATATVAAPVAPIQAVTVGALYTTGAPYPVRASSSRGYAQAQLAACAKAHPNGFTLAQYRAALVNNLAQMQGTHAPKGGWAKHNMPTWALGQGWLKPVAAKPVAAKA